MKFLDKIPFLVLAAPLALLAACFASPEQKQRALARAAQKALMARHDSLMAKEDQLFALKAQITATHSPAARSYLRGLAAADAAMMDWMHQYRAPDSTAEPGGRLAYFRQQERVLAGVSQKFRATLDSAALFISQRPAAAPTAAPVSTK